MEPASTLRLAERSARTGPNDFATSRRSSTGVVSVEGIVTLVLFLKGFSGLGDATAATRAVSTLGPAWKTKTELPRPAGYPESLQHRRRLADRDTTEGHR
jgi:hypothetical protein